MINFREITSGPVALLKFLSLKPYYTIETIQDKKTRKALIGESKGAQVHKARINDDFDVSDDRKVFKN